MEIRKLIILIFSLVLGIFAVIRILFYGSNFGGYLLIAYSVLGILFPLFKIKKRLILILGIIYIIVGCGVIGIYVYTHAQEKDIIPPKVMIRLMEGENPVINAICSATIYLGENETKKDLIYWPINNAIECYGREKCNITNYQGYYVLTVAPDFGYEPLIQIGNFSFFLRAVNVSKGDFRINIVCRTDHSVAYFIMNQTNFPCSPYPLTGNYLSTTFLCSNDSKLIKTRAYSLNKDEFDQYDQGAVDFLIKNYQNKTILANDKLEFALDSCNLYKKYSCGVKPVGIVWDTKGYGNPNVFQDFIFADCEQKNEIIKEYDIDLILSRFELESCDFMKQIYKNVDYIYWVIKE